jgi:hypothetical protein
MVIWIRHATLIQVSNPPALPAPLQYPSPFLHAYSPMHVVPDPGKKWQQAVHAGADGDEAGVVIMHHTETELSDVGLQASLQPSTICNEGVS